MRAPIVVVGAGFGGLAAALALVTSGEDVLVLERGIGPGGKARSIEVGGKRIDVGPTVLTMRWVFDQLFAAAGRSLDEAVTITRAETIARHAFTDGSRLDLFDDVERNVDAVGRFAGAREAEAYRRFAAHAQGIAELVRGPFLCSERPSIASLATSGLGIGALARVDAHRSMWRALRSFFDDPRLVMLFARYATYVGSSPFDAPATLNLIAHVEREGVGLVDGGISRLAGALAELAASRGVEFRYGCAADEIVVERGRACGVLAAQDGAREFIPARAVVLNVDRATVASGAFGAPAARAVGTANRRKRSLSAVTWVIDADVSGVPLAPHNVFFPSDYAREHRALFGARRLPEEPTVYVCAQDRGALAGDPRGQGERLLVIVNAPADADEAPIGNEEIERCERTMLKRLASSGVTIEPRAMTVATPASFEHLYPATGGAIYGEACHGAFAPLSRPSSRTTLPGLYLAGGSVHPGPGVPMAALSGKLAATAVLTDFASMRPSRASATAGSTWMR